MVDFASVRPHRGSQNNAFEELVVQLARRRPPPDAREFRRIEGAGGDAGVEALWLKSGGSATGIQAKYFLRVRDIDWNQIDKSVATTLRHRPEVDVYQIALACDLTDRRGAKGRGKTGWAAWEERVKRWEADALTLGRTVSFEPITASDLVDWLGQPSAAGLARYWFGTDVLGLPGLLATHGQRVLISATATHLAAMSLSTLRSHSTAWQEPRTSAHGCFGPSRPLGSIAYYLFQRPFPTTSGRPPDAQTTR